MFHGLKFELNITVWDLKARGGGGFYAVSALALMQKRPAKKPCHCGEYASRKVGDDVAIP
ncbi:MAG: hypothetical protein ACHQIM_07980 [Sphingobacteriales bacterium]